MAQWLIAALGLTMPAAEPIMHGHGATPPSAATPGKRTNRAPAPSAASPSTVLKAPPPFGRDDQPHSGVVPAEHMRSGLATSPRRLTRQLSPPSLAGAVRRAAPFGVTSDVYASRAATGADGSVSFIPASDCAPFKTAPRTDNARPAESAPRARHRKPGADAAIWGLSGDGGSPIAHDDDAAVAERVSANVAFFRYDSRERGYEPQSHLKARKVSTAAAVFFLCCLLRSFVLFSAALAGERHPGPASRARRLGIALPKGSRTLRPERDARGQARL